MHYNYIFGHPEVYILILPGFGIITNVIQYRSDKKGVFGYIGMVRAIGAIGGLGLTVWAHHIYSIYAIIIKLHSWNGYRYAGIF